jgi:hypothetical protein
LKNGLTGAKPLCYKHFHTFAGVAQLVEQLIRNQQVRSSTLRVGSKNKQRIQSITRLNPFFISSPNPANSGKLTPDCNQNANSVGAIIIKTNNAHPY